MKYIKSFGNKSVTDCNIDYCVLDGGSIVLLSLVDLNIRTKKVVADIIGNDFSTASVELLDREDLNSSIKLSIWNKRFHFKHDRMGEMTHTLIASEDISQYCFDTANIGKIPSITAWLRSKHFIPVNEHIVEVLLNIGQSRSHLNWCEELKTFSNNPGITISGYKINPTMLYSLFGKVTNHEYDGDFDWSEIETIDDYIFAFTDSIRNRISKNIKSLYKPENVPSVIFEGKIKPYTGQIPIIGAGIEVLKRSHCLYIAAEQGIGKTTMASKINHASLMNRNYSTLIVAPAITLTQWEKEIQDSLPNHKSIDVVVIRSTVDFIKEYNRVHDKPVYYLVGKETFKLDAKKVPGVEQVKRKIKARVVERMYYYGGERTVEKIVKVEYAKCPNCGMPLKNENRTKADYFLTLDDFGNAPRKSNYKCGNCQAVLWQSTYDKTKKTSLINYIKVKNIRFDSIICDESHESNNSNSIIGNALRTVFNYGNKIILLSGTTNNGYASSLHNILLGLFSRKLKSDGCLELDAFVAKYGTLQAVNKREDGVYHRSGRSRIKDSDFKEIEGLNPVIFAKYLAENYIFAALSDLEKDLPPLIEEFVPVEHIYSAEENKLIEDIRDANAFNYKMYEDSIIRHWVNNPFGWTPITIEKGEDTEIIYPSNLDETVLLPKEIKLIEIIKKEVSEGRKSWVFTDFSGESGNGQYMQGKNIPERLKEILEKEGIRVFWLRPNVAPIDRKELIESKKDKYDVFISNAKLVQVGINMSWCGTWIHYIPSYHVNVLLQSSRRGYRADSQIENRIYYMYYANSIENIINQRFQRKALESKAIEGRFNVATESESFRTASALGKKIDSNLVR